MTTAEQQVVVARVRAISDARRKPAASRNPRRELNKWRLEQHALLLGWIEGAEERWPHRRIVVALRLILAGERDWQLKAADALGGGR